MIKNYNSPLTYPEYRDSGRKRYVRGGTVHVLKKTAQDAANYYRTLGYRAIVMQVKKPNPTWRTTGRWIVYLRKP